MKKEYVEFNESFSLSSLNSWLLRAKMYLSRNFMVNSENNCQHKRGFIA